MERYMKSILKEFPNFSWSNIKAIHNLQMKYPKVQDGHGKSLLIIQFLYEEGESKYDFLFYFYAPRTLVLETSGEYQQISLTVHNMKERGWEGILYEVEDYEEQRLSFYCEDIEFIHAEKM